MIVNFQVGNLGITEIIDVDLWFCTSNLSPDFDVGWIKLDFHMTGYVLLDKDNLNNINKRYREKITKIT